MNKNITEIQLSNLRLKTFTQQDALDYCLLNNINIDNIKELSLYDNELIDISGIKIFKNIKVLRLHYNKPATDISVLKDLNSLEELYLFYNGIKDISVIKDLKNLERLDISNNQIIDI